MLPLTAVMVTRGRRHALARMAVQSFLDQQYADKQLLIVNSGPAIYKSGSEPPAVTETLVPDMDSAPLGYVRNWSLQTITARTPDRWIMQWDDDDWSHPERMTYQVDALMASRNTSQAVILFSQVRIDLTQQVALVYNWPSSRPAGIPGTVLLPPRRVKHYAYDQTLRKHEDSLMLLGSFPESTLVLRNTATPHLYLRLFHGENTWNRKHFFQGQPTFSFDSLQPKATADYVINWYANHGQKLVN